ncbi:MAG TPA: hypothetical protein PLY92_14680, partial [Niabella sp.]|nr:hypothetical protein [Niabella sp.]
NRGFFVCGGVLTFYQSELRNESPQRTMVLHHPQRCWGRESSACTLWRIAAILIEASQKCGAFFL